MRWITLSLTLLLISALLSGCSLNKQSDSSVQKSPIKADISVSLAHSYDTYDQLVSASNLIGVVKILNINHVDTNEGATYYNAKVLDPYKTSDKKVSDIVVKQLGIQNKNDFGKTTVEGTKLFQKDKEAVLFLKHAYDNVYYISGEYQGNYDIQDGKVYSRDNHVDRSSHANGVALSEFKKKIVDLANK